MKGVVEEQRKSWRKRKEKKIKKRVGNEKGKEMVKIAKFDQFETWRTIEYRLT